MVKKTILHGLSAGLLSAISCLVYSQIHTATTGADYSSVITLIPVMVTCLLGSLGAAAGYLLLKKLIKDLDTCDVVFNIAYVFLTFLSCIYPLSVRLSPQDFETPELFNGLVIPMHFFPVLFWITLNPVFKNMKIK